MDAYYLKWGRRAFKPDDNRFRVMAKLCQGPRVLDVGCGTGDMLLLLQLDDLVLGGTDISRAALGICIGRGVEAELHLTSIIPTGPWDTIIMGQLLEHLDDDEVMVDMAARELAPGGRLVVSVPCEDQVQSPDHKREYTVRDAVTLLGRVGKVHQFHWAGEQARLILWAEKGNDDE
jgi:2-polyprenyl-3-methyl-5-hydroxy-6-metoxy-1,4-benzoquinol methylase